MAKYKKLLLALSAVAVFAGYVIVCDYIVGLFFKPAEPAAAAVYGVLEAESADGETDPYDENEDTIFNIVDAWLKYNTDGNFSSLKMIALYKFTLQENAEMPEGGETVEMEISEEMANVDNLTLLYVSQDRSGTVIPAAVETRTRINDQGASEEYYVITFTASEQGYYAFAGQRTYAGYAWLLAFGTIGAAVALYLVLFFIFKPAKPADILQKAAAADIGKKTE